jgi:hypothetical protein
MKRMPHALKIILFHLLYTFRGIIRFILKMLAGIGLMGLIVLGAISLSGERLPAILYWTAGFWFVAPNLLLWTCDVILLKLKPDDIELFLAQ